MLFLGLCMPLPASDQITFSSIKGSHHTEISTLIMKEAYKRLGIKLEVKNFPGKRSIRLANDGEYAGELFRIDGMDTVFTNLIKVPVVISYIEGMAFTKNLEFDIEGWNSLSPYKLGVRAGIIFSDRGTKGMTRFEFNTNKKLFELLEAERVDLVIISRLNGLAEIQKMDETKVKALEPSIEKYNLFHYLHKDNKELLPKLIKVLNQMKAEGLMEKIRGAFIEKML